jgi:hypothetical protein
MRRLRTVENRLTFQPHRHQFLGTRLIGPRREEQRPRVLRSLEQSGNDQRLPDAQHVSVALGSQPVLEPGRNRAVRPPGEHGQPREQLSAGPCEVGCMAGTGTALRRTSVLELAPLPGATSCARLHAVHVMHEWGLRALTDDVTLIVSELITNAAEASIVLPERPPGSPYACWPASSPW